MAAPSRVGSMIVVIFCLAALGAALFYQINKLSTDAGGTPAASSVRPSSSLHDAAGSGDLTVINAAITSKVDLDAPLTGVSGRNGQTPLMLAATSGKADVVGALVGGGAKVNARAADGKTPLMLAAGWADAGVVRALLDASARVDERDENRWTALMMAAARGSAESVKTLLDAGADVGARNKWQQTALMIAAQSGSSEKVTMLLSAGANVNDQDQSGATALALLAASEDANADGFESLIGARADVNAADMDGLTPLMRAADKGDAQRVIALLNAGGQSGLRDRQGRSAADWATARDDEKGREIAGLLADAK